MDVWTPVQDEMLILRREPTNISDRNAAVLKENQVVGHVPFNLAPSISLFLRRDINKAFAKVAGEKVQYNMFVGQVPSRSSVPRKCFTI